MHILCYFCYNFGSWIKTCITVLSRIKAMISLDKNSIHRVEAEIVPERGTRFVCVEEFSVENTRCAKPVNVASLVDPTIYLHQIYTFRNLEQPVKWTFELLIYRPEYLEFTVQFSR